MICDNRWGKRGVSRVEVVPRTSKVTLPAREHPISLDLWQYTGDGTDFTVFHIDMTEDEARRVGNSLLKYAGFKGEPD